jgi:hypothetical protein
MFILLCSRPIYTTALFYTFAPTCFGSSMPSSVSFWIRLSYVKILIDLVVFHIMWLSSLCAGESWVRLLCFPAEALYDIPPNRSVFS